MNIHKLMKLAVVAVGVICLGAQAANEDKTWMAVDLRTGAISYYGYDLTTATNTFNTAEYKTEKMVFRRVPEELYYVRAGAAVATMERPYYIGMFPVTVAQYRLMLDSTASVSETAEDMRAVANVSYADLRGSGDVPTAFGGGLGDGPIARLNARVTSKLGPFDLPTESMWEVAARAIESGDATNKTWQWFFGASDALLLPQSGYPNIRQLGGSFANGSDRCRTSDGGGWANNANGAGANIGFRLAMICDKVTYEITWLNDDGTTIDTTVVDDGAMPTHADPTKAADAPFRYEFTGWMPAIETATSNTTYTAAFQRFADLALAAESPTSADGRSFAFSVESGTSAGDIKLKLGEYDVTKGFRVAVNGTEAMAVLLAPYAVPKEEGVENEMWTENGDGTVTLNVTVVPGLYYAAASGASLEALACPGASVPATDGTRLVAPKPVGGKDFFKVWVSDTPIPATP